MTVVTATLTEVRADLSQKWEAEEYDVRDHRHYIWLKPFQNKFPVQVGSKAKIEFVKGTGGATGGHWALWQVREIL
jgi:hypothetical protein